jgi:putative heme-binding domain-containing protein
LTLLVSNPGRSDQLSKTLDSGAVLFVMEGNMKRWLALVFFALVVESFAADGEDVIPHRQDQPPNKPYSPQEALARMSVPAGFKVELVASEPDIVNPIAMTFDDRGRIWITESIEYPRKPAGTGRDRIKIVEDTDLDGRADKVTVFADNLNIPTGVAVGYGGVWVMNAPDLLFLREENGKEVSREVVITGFGRTDTHELPNSLTWGPDGWLYGLNGVFNRCSVVGKDGKRHDFTCAMWRIHPRTHEFQVFAEGTSNPYGLAWDTEGSAIVEVCHWANDHLFHFVETGYYQRQAGAYPPFTMKIGSITDHGHQKTAYCGLAFLDSDTFPAQYRQRMCVGNIHGGCINVDQLQRDGATYLAKAEPDLLTANDAWFMPVSLKVGPDGCLYVLDWYDRYHCSQDAARDPSGVDRLKGRLYRLRYGDTPRAAKFNLASESDDQLVSRLGSGNIFFRESAQRILTERMGDADRSVRVTGMTELRGRLQKLVLDERAPRKARLHALWVLIGSGSLDPSFHERLLAHGEATFRAWAVRAAGNFGDVNPGIREKVASLARDLSADVQVQVAIASRKIKGCDPLPVLVEVLAHCGQDKLNPAIVWPNLHPLLETESARFVSLVESATAKDGSLPPAIATLMPRAIERALSARSPDAAAVAALLEYAIQRAPERVPACVAALSGRLGGLNEATVADLKQQLRPVIEKVLADHGSTSSVRLLAARLGIGSIDVSDIRRKFLSVTEPEAARLQALEALVAFRDESLLNSLPEVISSARPEFTTRVFAALGRCDEPKLADVLIVHYPKLAAEIQPLAIDLIMQREPWARKLLDAVLANKLPKEVLHANHLRKIVESNDREALWAVERAFGKIREERNPERQKVVAEMGEYFRKNIGDPVAGQRVFRNLCAQCHTIYGEGGQAGPDLTANGRGSFEQVVSSVFDPSLVIGPGYQTVTVVTTDGRNLTGLVTEDSEQRVVLTLPGEGEEAIPRNAIRYTHVSKLSMMPEGIESLLDRKELADLFAFLALDKPPTDPTATPIPGAPTVSTTRPRALDP